MGNISYIEEILYSNHAIKLYSSTICTNMPGDLIDQCSNNISIYFIMFFFLIKLMSGITMNFDISVRLILQKSSIICHHMKCIIKKGK